MPRARGSRTLDRWSGLLLLALFCAVAPTAVHAAPIKVRYPEGPAHGFLALSDLDGKPIAHGELIQWVDKRQIVSRLLFYFDDGSLYDEVVAFTQRPVFRVTSYHLVQKGPSFTPSSEVRFDRSGRYSAQVRSAPDKEPETDSGTVEIPDDVSNGMTSTLLKNLPHGAAATTHMLAFTPQPHVLEVHFTPRGSAHYRVGRRDRSAARYQVDPEVTGLSGAIASVLGKQPAPLQFWIASGKAPVMVRFEGPLYNQGPPWRVEMSAPRWVD
jgi:hypothetical protein